MSVSLCCLLELFLFGQEGVYPLGQGDISCSAKGLGISHGTQQVLVQRLTVYLGKLFQKWSAREARVDQHTWTLSQLSPKLFAIFLFNHALESLIHPAGAQLNIAPFTLRLPQNTQKHQQSPRKQLSDIMAGTESEASKIELARELTTGTASSALVCEAFIARSEFSFELICASWHEKLFSL